LFFKQYYLLVLRFAQNLLILIKNCFCNLGKYSYQYYDKKNFEKIKILRLCCIKIFHSWGRIMLSYFRIYYSKTCANIMKYLIIRILTKRCDTKIVRNRTIFVSKSDSLAKLYKFYFYFDNKTK
jgi:hypothetical protein